MLRRKGLGDNGVGCINITSGLCRLPEFTFFLMRTLQRFSVARPLLFLESAHGAQPRCRASPRRPRGKGNFHCSNAVDECVQASVVH